MPCINDWQKRYEKLAVMKDNHDTCNYTELGN